MTDASRDVGELRSSYRTLNEPTKLIGLSLGAWAAVIAAGAVAYAFLAVSPLPWRVNFSVIVIGLGAPVGLVVLREPGTIGPGRLLMAVFAWRLRPAILVPQHADARVKCGAVRLDTAIEPAEPANAPTDPPWANTGTPEVVR